MPDFTPTDEQLAILNHEPDRHGRILAGPGTGKSATVVAWLDSLLGGEEAPRARMLTFTRAAASELARKVAEHPNAATQRPGTVHSFAISALLRNEGVADFPSPLRLADDWESSVIVMRTLARRLGIRISTVRKLFIELAAGWDALDDELRNPDIDDEVRNRFRAGWLEHRRVYGYTLLGELPYALRRALINHPDLQGVNYDILIVDEYQDLNPCELDILRLLAGRGCSLLATGDDDQSIYSFRQAYPQGIRRFCQEFEGAADYPLSITHRCGARIIEWATYVIEGDLDREPDKPQLTPAEGSPPGEVALLRFAGHTAEARGIARLVEHLIQEEGLLPSEILILLRGDYQQAFSGPIKTELQRLDIPYSDPDAVKAILAEPRNRELLARLRLLVDRHDSLAWGTLLQLTLGIGDAFRDGLYDRSRAEGCQLGETLLAWHSTGFEKAPAAARTRANVLVNDTLEWLENHAVTEETPELGWGRWIVDLAAADDEELDTDTEELLLGVDEIASADLSLSQYLGQVTPLAKDKAQTESTGVRIMSMTASKGLTVEATILPALEQGIIPRDDENISEERRLLYVAMTRAKRFVYGTWARRRSGPTARAGGGVVGARIYSSFLDAGPVQSQDGIAYLQAIGE